MGCVPLSQTTLQSSRHIDRLRVHPHASHCLASVDERHLASLHALKPLIMATLSLKTELDIDGKSGRYHLRTTPYPELSKEPLSVGVNCSLGEIKIARDRGNPFVQENTLENVRLSRAQAERIYDGDPLWTGEKLWYRLSSAYRVAKRSKISSIAKVGHERGSPAQRALF